MGGAFKRGYGRAIYIYGVQMNPFWQQTSRERACPAKQIQNMAVIGNFAGNKAAHHLFAFCTGLQKNSRRQNNRQAKAGKLCLFWSKQGDSFAAAWLQKRQAGYG